MSKVIRCGNSSSYGKSEVDRLQEVRCTEAMRPTLSATYDRLQSREFADISMTGRDIARGLEFLAAATDDEVFRSAALAIQAYGLDKGGLKASTLKMLRDNQRTAEWGAMSVMHQLI
jgi:hypothetical protein